MVLDVHRNHKAYQGREEGEEVAEEGDYKYLSLHCRLQNDAYIKTGSDESHYNVSLIMKDRVTRQYPHRPQFLKGKESRSGFEPRSLKPRCLTPCR